MNIDINTITNLIFLALAFLTVGLLLMIRYYE